MPPNKPARDYLSRLRRPCEFCGCENWSCACPLPGTYIYAWRKFTDALGELVDALAKAYRIDALLGFLTRLFRKGNK